MRASASDSIACILGLEALGPRMSVIRQLTYHHLEKHELNGRTLLLRYRLAACPELSRIVEIERSCCAFLRFRLEQDAEGCELTITAPEGAEDAMRWLSARFLAALEDE
ncbi:hypothetical protein WG902_14680 [Ramlibacter sp. PS3R-8]|uniref:hypothetical protein n=1 Tax=Ramlibacter sp. PS3R-8 TaxID=3133437 RepID=UPI00309BED74